MKTRRVRVHFFNPWARALEDISVYLDNIPHLDLSEWVERPDDADLLQRARLDCDWHGECARCFSSLVYHGVEFLPARILGVEGLLNLAQVSQSNSGGEEWWLCLMAQHPQIFANIAGSLFALLRQRGVRILYYAFDEASRRMPCFDSIAPHLNILIHDEYPLSATPEMSDCPPKLDCKFSPIFSVFSRNTRTDYNFFRLAVRLNRTPPKADRILET
jgi:hypothetical protein